jgi:hypothetical protein
MKRDIEGAVRAAVNGLYSGSNDAMEEALWEILESLDPEIAQLFSEDEEAALTTVNKDAEVAEDEPLFDDDLSVYDEEDFKTDD